MSSEDTMEALSGFSETDDRVLPFQVAPLDVRGRAVYLGPAIDTILSRHNYPRSVSKLVAEATVLTALLGTALKFDGQFILQTQTDGPVSMLVVDFRSPGDIRACATFDAEAVKQAEAEGLLGHADLIGDGVLAMTIDQGAHMRRYQGIVPLENMTLEDATHHYFQQSEQIPTEVRVSVAQVQTRGENGAQPMWRAAGIMVQFLPESEERMRQADLPGGDNPDDEAETTRFDEDDAWTEAKALLRTVEDHELTEPSVTAEQLLYRLYHERGVHVFDSQKLVERCGCSEARIRDVLSQLSPEEIEDSIENGEISATCEFCSVHYRFDPSEFRS
ncbi:Hsp33 family molecular chaperone [Coralliovum pocilloporae]|uniref:Hsp33 family molecular chaperone n=1 Tax=Coralliovum pocilloporae TaxID=3066369 RepID=UPI003306E8F1